MPETENVEIMENVEEIVDRGSANGGKTLIYVALGVAAITAAGYGIKLVRQKLAAKKQAKEQTATEAPSQDKTDDSIGNNVYIEDETK